jgi:iron-sulfur cluster assembly protein
MIKVSLSAKEQIIKLKKEDSINQEYLRVGVKGGGCSGLSYILDFDNHYDEKNDELFEDNDIKIICDKRSLLYIFGTELTFSGGLNGKGFEFINPNASRTCSCGESFAV